MIYFCKLPSLKEPSAKNVMLCIYFELFWCFRPSSDGVTSSFKRQAPISPQTRVYPYHSSAAPNRGYTDLQLFTTSGSLYRDPHYPVEHQVEYTLDNRYAEEHVQIRRRPTLLPAPPDYGGSLQERMCRGSSRLFEYAYYNQELAARAAEHEQASFYNSKRPRLSTDPKLSIQQPLLIDVRDVKKEPAYTPQVEAISPTPTIVEDHRSPKDELLQNINKIDREIGQLELQIANLNKKQTELVAEANKPPANKPDSQDGSTPSEPRRMSIAQRIYSENRRKAFQRNMILDKLGEKYQSPLYNQPSDIILFNENKQKFLEFKIPLIQYFLKKNKERQLRETYLTETYNKLMQSWLKKMEKRENNTTRRIKENKLREFFEKQFPELKKQREDRERFSRVGQRIRSDAELEEIMDGLQEQENEDKKMRSYAVIPPIILEPQAQTHKFTNTNGLVEDLKAEFKERQMSNIWTEQEKEIFKEKFLQHPKAFVLISASLERKSVADCVQYYYLTKKTNCYKLLLRKSNAKRRTRALVKANSSSSGSITTRQQEENKAAVSSGGSDCSTNGPTDGAAAEEVNDKTDKEERERNSLQVNENGEIFTCCICKSPLDNQSRPLTKTNCEFLGLKENITPHMRVCTSCRFKSVRRRCEVPVCKTPKRKVKKLRPLPSKWAELNPDVKDALMKEFQITSNVTRCCSACFNRITRKIEGTSSEVTESNNNYQWSNEETDLLKQGLQEHGTNWPLVAQLVATKVEEQCHGFYTENKHKLGFEGIVKAYKERVGAKMSEDEESGETTSSCDEDNCADRNSSDTASASSPLNKVTEENAGEKVKEIARETSQLVPAPPPERPEPPAKTSPKRIIDYDSSSTLSADEAQMAESQGPSPPLNSESSAPPIKSPFLRPPDAELPNKQQPAVKEEPTCVRDLIFQAIEMSLQSPGKPCKKKLPPTSLPLNPSPSLRTVIGNGEPPVAHKVQSLTTRPELVNFDNSAEDDVYQVQDLSKKTKPKEREPTYPTKPVFLRPESRTNNYSPYGHPPPAHYNSRNPPQSSSHDLYAEQQQQQQQQQQQAPPQPQRPEFYYTHQEPSNKHFNSSQPPHLVAQQPVRPKSIKVPPPPPLITNSPSPKMYKENKTGGSITQGTPQPPRYDSGSITLGTPVHQDLKMYEKSEMPRTILYEPAAIEQYYRHVPPYSPYVGGRVPYASSKESQLSSNQIMIDFNTSKQMQMRQQQSGSNGDKDPSSRSSPRSRELSSANSREIRLHSPFSAYPPNSAIYLAAESRLPHSPLSSSLPDSQLADSPSNWSQGKPPSRQNVIHRSITWGTSKPSVIQAPKSTSPRTMEQPSKNRAPPPPSHQNLQHHYQSINNDALHTLVNAAVAQIPCKEEKQQHSLVITSHERNRSPKPRMLAEGLEKSLIEMHQRPNRTYQDTFHHNSEPFRMNERLGAENLSSDRKQHIYLASSNSSHERHYFESQSENDNKPKHISENSAPHPTLRISGMREPFSREQFERQMRQDMARPPHELSYMKKEDERKKIKMEDKNPPPLYQQQQQQQQSQMEMDSEASRLFCNSFQRDPNPKTQNRAFTTANLIDAIITRQISQNTDIPSNKPSSDTFNRYRPLADQRPNQIKRKSREEVVTIDDEPSGEKERFSFNHNDRPGSRGRSPGSAQEAMYNVPFSGPTDKTITLGEHIASIISKDYSTTNDVHPPQPLFSHSRPGTENTTNSLPIHRQSPHIISHNHMESHHPRSHEAPPDGMPDHSAQNCPGKGCVYHHNWKLRNALQQSKETERPPSNDRNIIQISQAPPIKNSKSPSVSSISPYIGLEPISPPNPSSESTGDNIQASTASWSTNSNISGLLSSRRQYPSHDEIPPLTSLASPKGGGRAPPQLSLSPLDYVKNRIVEVMRTASDGSSDNSEQQQSKGMSVMPHLSEEHSQPSPSNRYLHVSESHSQGREAHTPQSQQQRYSPAMNARPSASSKHNYDVGEIMPGHWPEGRATPSRFRPHSVSPSSSDLQGEERPRKRMKEGHYAPESSTERGSVHPESSDPSRGGIKESVSSLLNVSSQQQATSSQSEMINRHSDNAVESSTSKSDVSSGLGEGGNPKRTPESPVSCGGDSSLANNNNAASSSSSRLEPVSPPVQEGVSTSNEQLGDLASSSSSANRVDSAVGSSTGGGNDPASSVSSSQQGSRNTPPPPHGLYSSFGSSVSSSSPSVSSSLPYPSFTYPFSALSVRSMAGGHSSPSSSSQIMTPLPSLQSSTVSGTAAPLLSSQYEPLSDED